MFVVICYDVSTISKEGRRRLRTVAKTCENWGQRVQKSVFECNLSEVHFERLLQTLKKIMDAEEDSLRIYRLTKPHERFIETYGIQKVLDFDEPLVL